MSKTDARNIELVKLIAQLRDHIDVQRIIGLNVEALRDTGISNALLGYLQKTAHEASAIYFCKIFESSTRNELNSIAGIIDSIPQSALTDEQKREFSAFGRRYGNGAVPLEAKPYLKDTLSHVLDLHREAFGRLKEFRDTIGAHSDANASIKSLPSHAEFEALFQFASDFYQLVYRSINGVGPASIPRKVGRGLIRLMESMGARTPAFDFKEEGTAAGGSESGQSEDLKC